jgi:hypothetical protein
LHKAVETLKFILAEVMNGGVMVQSVYSAKAVTWTASGARDFDFHQQYPEQL